MQLKEFVASFKIDKDLSKRSKIGILKIIKKDLNVRMNAEGEITERISWLKNTLRFLNPRMRAKKTEQANEMKPQQEIEALKEKQQVEKSDLMTKLALVKDSSAETTKLMSENDTLMITCAKIENVSKCHQIVYWDKSSKFWGKLENRVRQIN